MDKEKDIQQEFHQRADSKRFLGRLNNPFIKEKEFALFGRLGDIEGLTLEIGCGEGSNKQYISQLNPRMKYIGLDFSFEKVSFARKFDSSTSFIQANAVRLPFKENSFDAIIIRDVLHHVDSFREEIIKEALRTLRSGGKLWIIEGNVKKLVNRAFSLLVPAERGMKNSTPGKFSTLCEKFGCERIEFVEPFFFVRAINFFLGWSENGFLKPLLIIIYSSTRAAENFFVRFISEKNKSYMIAFLGKRKKDL